jgi:hypothetical protein
MPASERTLPVLLFYDAVQRRRGALVHHLQEAGLTNNLLALIVPSLMFNPSTCS